MVEGPWFAASCRVAAPVKLSLPQRGPRAVPLNDLHRPYLLAQKFAAFDPKWNSAKLGPAATVAQHLLQMLQRSKERPSPLCSALKPCPGARTEADGIFEPRPLLLRGIGCGLKRRVIAAQNLAEVFSDAEVNLRAFGFGMNLFVLIAIFAAPGDAASQAAKLAEVQPVNVDAAPVPESGRPDPLAPPEQVDRPAPLAPGASAAVAATPPLGQVDAVVALVRQRLEHAPVPGGLGGRGDLSAVTAYYSEIAQPLWTSKAGLTPKAQQVIDEIGHADDWGLRASDFEVPKTIDPSPSVEALAEAEMKLALAVVKYARHARGGRVDPPSVSRKFDQKPAIFDPRSVLAAIGLADAGDRYLQGLHPKHAQFAKLRLALLAARAAAAQHAELSAKPTASIQQLIVNMERWRWMPPDLGPFYVWDSIPDQITSVISDGKVAMSEKIVVGKLSSPTPIFSADMQFIIFHPSWGVPPGMKEYELAPKLRDTGGGWFSTKPLASEVLRAQGLQATRNGVPVDPDKIDWSSTDIRSFEFTQGPGATNVLGAVKFRFPNKHDVYMHDTPERNLFGGNVRAFSHGCMRVQNPMHLAEVLLAQDKSWSAEQVKGYARRGSEVALTTPIPVHVTYFTATVSDTGAVVTLPDIYDLDSRVASALEGRNIVVSSANSAARERIPVSEQPAHPAAKTHRKTAYTPPQPTTLFEALFGQ